MQILWILLINGLMGWTFAADSASNPSEVPQETSFPLWKGQKASLIGDVYDLEGKTKHYTYARYGRLAAGDPEIFNVFRDLEGKVVVVESAKFENGQMKSYAVDHQQRNQKALIQVKGETVHFQKTKGSAKPETDTESVEKNFIVGMTLIPYLYQNWATLMKGESIKARFGVWSRLETVGFKFWKEKDEKDKVVIVMKPTSFVIRALVDPLYFTFDKTSKEILQLTGRTTPSIKDGGKWKELDALIKYREGPNYHPPVLPGAPQKPEAKSVKTSSRKALLRERLLSRSL